MTRVRSLFRAGLFALVIASLAAPAGAAEGSVEQALHLAMSYSQMLRDMIAILERRPDASTLWAALYDARRAVAEIDRVSANAAILQASARDRQRFLGLSAEAHLHLALFETHGLEFDRAAEEIERARSISDHVELPNFRTTWTTVQTGRPDEAMVTRHNLLTLPEFEAALGAIWYRARPVSFEFHGFGLQELMTVKLLRTGPPPPDTADARLLARGTAELTRALERGDPTFTIFLPPGLYRLGGRPGGDIDRAFMVPESTDVDRVVVDRARLELEIEPEPDPDGPRFFLNGIEVTDFTSMPYGVYRVKADPDDYPDAPQVIRFILGRSLPDKTRSSWTIHVPAGGSTKLQFDRSRMGK